MVERDNPRFLRVVVAVRSASPCAIHLVNQPLVVDRQLRVVWAPGPSMEQIGWLDALRMSREFDLGGFHDWRLPTLRELQSIVIHELVDSEDPRASNVPIHSPFNRCNGGYIHSGAQVADCWFAPYILNVRNGHIFNGQGYRAYAWYVRTRNSGRPRPFGR